MIYLWEGTTEESLTRGREAFLEYFVCAATGHQPATRNGFNSTSCLCGVWHRQVTWPADDEVSMVTVEALREEVRQCQRRIQDLRGALEDTIEYRFDYGHGHYAGKLTDILNGKATT